jgi:hypothetical protein
VWHAPGEPNGAAATAAVECYASFIDGDGGQMILILEPAVGGPIRLSSFFVSDHRGLADCFGTEAASRQDVAEMLQGLDSEEVGWVSVERSYCRARVWEAKDINRRSHRRLPAEFEVWKDALGGELSGPVEVTLSEGLLSAEERLERLGRTDALLDLPGFQSWLLPGADLAPFLPTLLSAVGKPRRQRRALLDEALTACIRLAFQERQCRVWRARLHRQAYLWERRDPETARTCLAAAWGLSGRAPMTLDTHPFVREMVLASFAVALGTRLE